ncbi:MAG TPA: hypothetical protein ENN09_02460, partial [Planctomycetes bacterium]|nr:hypothetical protein [Planctomycetota bacterium]
MRAAVLFSAVLLAAGTACGLYRGDEYEPRNWRFDSEYTIDVLTFQLPRRMVRMYREAERAYMVTAGSVRPEDMYIVQMLKIPMELDGPWNFAFYFDMSEDWDGIYHHHRLELNMDMKAGWQIYGFGEPLAEKEYSDIGFGFRYMRDDMLADIAVAWPNLWWNEKNELGSVVLQRPLNLRFSGEMPSGKGIFLPWFDLDFRSIYTYDFDAFNFRFEKYRLGLEYELPVNERLFVWAAASAEYCRKRRWGYAPGDPADFTLARDAGRVQAEYEWWFIESDALTAGFLWNYINEDTYRPNDPAATVYMQVNEFIPYLAWTRKVNERFLFSTGVYADWVVWQELYPGNPAADKDFAAWRVKVPFRFMFPGPAGELVV